MKITDVSVILVSTSTADSSWANAYGRGAKKSSVLVEISTDEGISGFGEAYHAVHPRAVASIVVHELKPMLLGRDPDDVQGIWDDLFFATLQLGSAAVAAISGVDIALWDIKGKSAGLPLHRLLGSVPERPIALYVGCRTLGIQPVKSLIEEAEGYVNGGFSALKIRGGSGVQNDVQAIAALRKHFGDELDLMIDANSAYSWPEASSLSVQLAEYKTMWLEDPFDFSVLYHHDEMGKLRSQNATPIASGGNLYTRFQCRDLIAAGGVDYLTPDIMKCGGLTEALRIAALASAHGIIVAPHTAIGLGQVATLHYAAAVPSHVRGYVEWDPSSPNPLRDEILTNPVSAHDGRAQLPTTPGVGTGVAAEAVSKYPFIDGPEVRASSRTRRWNL